MNIDKLYLRSLGAAVGLAVMLAVFGFLSPVYAQMTEEQLAKIPGGDQPIKFSHKVHAGDNEIPCQYCHIYARRSQVSGAPPMQICMGCHKLIATNLSEVKKLTKFWEDKQPIPWVKIHDVPDFVRFIHQKHINARNEVYPKGLACQTCHGPIQEMHVVKKFNPSFGDMGWCLECHLTIPGALERKRAMAVGPDSKTLKNMLRPSGEYRPNLTDCMTCHK
ncbi:MAG: cytochrome c3 family protein [SAR324 cluster bacterium]|nr:cytochrome c3 family protein [SAR324 cluster bacterium]